MSGLVRDNAASGSQSQPNVHCTFAHAAFIRILAQMRDEFFSIERHSVT